MEARAAVIGAGSWGTAVALLLARNGVAVHLYCHREDAAAAINATRRNAAYFPGLALPVAITATADLAEALGGGAAVQHSQGSATRLAYLIVPTSYLETVCTTNLGLLKAWSAAGGMLCNCSKGLLLNPVRRTDDWLAKLLPQARLAQLSGPNLAAEIVAGQPAAAVAAGQPEAAAAVQAQLSSARFRVYTGTDMVGAEVAGFYKNILAIAAGMVYGLGLGDNTRAVLMTRGLAEMTRLTRHFGGEAATLYGLAGVGDVIVTCGSPLSRNFRAGQLRASGLRLPQVIEALTAPGGARSVAEGIQASLALHNWPAELGAGDWPELPIAEEVYRILHEDADPAEAIGRLMNRPPKAE